MKTNFYLALLLTLLLAACGNSASQQPAPVGAAEIPTATGIQQPAAEKPYQPVFEPGECPFALPQGFTSGNNVTCGYLLVPEDRSAPGSDQIRLAVAIFHSLNPENDTAPVVYIEGGPGMGALEPLQYTISKFTPVLQNHDLIFYDQRGVGFSQPALDCPEHASYVEQALERHQTPEETVSQLMDVFDACYQRLVEEGINLSMYNTFQSASDLEDLRLALGFESWNLYSISYGTRLALETIRQFPDGIRSVILDSAVPPEADPIAEAPANVGTALDTFFAACRDNPDCNKAFPNLEPTLYALVADLNAQPIQVPVANLLTGAQYNSVVDGRTFLGIVIQSLYSADVIPVIPMLITETAQGNYAKLSNLRSSFITSSGFISQGMYYTVRCNEEAPFSDRSKFAKSLANYPQLEGFFGASIGVSEATFTFCTQWEAGTASPVQNQPVLSSLPALVLGGQFDPSTPVYWSRQVAENLENSYFFEFPALGHGPSFSHPCPNSIALAFLNNPSQEPDSSCITSLETTFMVPSQLESLEFVPAEVPEYNIRAVVPAGWIAVKPEYYVSPDQSIELVISENQSEPLDAFMERWGAGEAMGTPTYNQLSWKVHPLSIPEKNIGGYLAVSENEQGFNFILIVGAQEKQETLYDHVFLPVLQAYTLTNK